MSKELREINPSSRLSSGKLEDVKVSIYGYGNKNTLFSLVKPLAFTHVLFNLQFICSSLKNGTWLPSSFCSTLYLRRLTRGHEESIVAASIFKDNILRVFNNIFLVKKGRGKQSKRTEHSIHARFCLKSILHALSHFLEERYFLLILELIQITKVITFQRTGE